MERILIICGSAGRGGVTETMCQAAAESMRSRGQDAMVVFPSEMRIEHCRGCDSCSDGPCVIDDDMHRLYRLFAESDFLILATPLHFSGPSSLTKTVMDRFQTYWHGKHLPHPIAMAGMMCAGSEHPNFGPTVTIMKAFAITTNMRWMGHLEFPGTDIRGDQGIVEAVDGFVSRLFSVGEEIPTSKTEPQGPAGDE